MKFGATLQQRSVPRWSGYNVDYNEIKNFIKEKTTHQDTTLPVYVPRQHDTRTEESKPYFEDELYNILNGQYDRINLFTKSKYGEIDRRINSLRHQLRQWSNLNSLRPQHSRRYNRLTQEINNVREEIQLLPRYIATQRMAFQKLIKKYHKWTGSSSLEPKFNGSAIQEINTKLFIPALDQILSHFVEVQTLFGEVQQKVREAGQSQGKKRSRKGLPTLTTELSTQSFTQSSTDDPASSVFSTGAVQSSTDSTSVGEQTSTTTDESATKKKRKSSPRINKLPKENIPNLQRYWNEFDNGDEEGQSDEYTILVDPDTSFPGAKLISSLYRGAKMVFSRTSEEKTLSEGDLRQPLLSSHDSCLSDNASTSEGSSTLPQLLNSGRQQYQSISHTSSRSSLRNRSRSRRRLRRERYLFYSYLACYTVTVALLLTSSLLEALGGRGLHRHYRKNPRLRKVHAAAAVGVGLALVFACTGTLLVARREDRLSWAHQTAVSLVMMIICGVSVWLVVVIGSGL